MIPSLILQQPSTPVCLPAEAALPKDSSGRAPAKTHPSFWHLSLLLLASEPIQTIIAADILSFCSYSASLALNGVIYSLCQTCSLSCLFASLSLSGSTSSQLGAPSSPLFCAPVSLRFEMPVQARPRALARSCPILMARTAIPPKPRQVWRERVIWLSSPTTSPISTLL